MKSPTNKFYIAVEKCSKFFKFKLFQKNEPVEKMCKEIGAC